MRRFGRSGLILAFVLSFLASPVRATSFSVDQSDLWYIVSESGWGIQLVERGAVIFATMFVYGPAGTPTWYVATMNSADGLTWTGDLYATTGPWFGTVPFDPAAVTARKVGTMTWSPQSLTAGTLNYVADGTAVTKNVVRETLVSDDYSGTYLGAFHAASTGCTDPSNNVSLELPLATVTVTQSGASVSLTLSVLALASMTISGTLSQSGQFGTVTGTYTDTTGDAGTATLSALNVQTNSLAGTFVEDSNKEGCHTVGYFAAMRSRP